MSLSPSPYLMVVLVIPVVVQVAFPSLRQLRHALVD